MAGWADLADRLLGSWEAMADELVDAEEDDMDHAAAALVPRAAHPVQPRQHPGLQKPQVATDIVAKLNRPIGHQAARPSLAALCQQTLEWVQHSGPGVHLDQSIPKINTFYVDSKKALHTSKEVVSRLIGEPPSKIEGGLAALASSYFHTDRWQQSKLEEALAQSACTLILYLELVKFDETPMKISEKDVVHTVPTPSVTADVTAPPATPPSGTAQLGSRGLAIGKSSLKAKFFATESKFAVLVKLDQPAVFPQEAPQHVLLEGSSLTTLQILGSASTMVMQQALLANRSVGSSAQRFVHKVSHCRSSSCQPYHREGHHGECTGLVPLAVSLQRAHLGHMPHQNV